MKARNLVYLIVLSLLLLTSSCIIIIHDKDRDDDDDIRCCAAEVQRMALFDGKTLDGWTVLKCAAAVDSGDILIQEGNGLIQTEDQYGDFILEFEWKALRDDKWDSGVYFRYNSVPEGRPWPRRYQVNLRQGMEGNVGGLEGANSEGLINPGKWNRFKLRVQGRRAALEINGRFAWEADGLEGPAEGFIALQAEVPGGGQHRFRRIYLTELYNFCWQVHLRTGGLGSTRANTPGALSPGMSRPECTRRCSPLLPFCVRVSTYEWPCVRPLATETDGPWIHHYCFYS